MRVGHRGVAALAPENSLASLRLAAELGLEMVEFDVVERDGTLVLAHEAHRAAGDDAATLGDALRLFAGELAETALQLDLKHPGCEEGVVQALREHGLVERALVSSPHPAGLRRLRALEPGLATSLTYPDDRHGLTSRPWLAPVLRGGLQLLRVALPRRLPGMCAAAGATAATLHYTVVSAELMRRCDAAGLPVLVWTVDDPVEAARLERLGVAAIITNDPRVFPLLK
jgi:glycerophosphoryl diester phosphodiesterase